MTRTVAFSDDAGLLRRTEDAPSLFAACSEAAYAALETPRGEL